MNVIVTVAEVNEPPRFDEDAPTVLKVTENANPLVITPADGDTPLTAGAYAVTDQDGSVDGPGGYDDTEYAYWVSGPDRRYFGVDEAGTLSFRTGHRPDFERKSSYAFTILARSGKGARMLAAALNVTIEVVNAEDPGSVLLSQRQPQVGFEIHATLSDPDGGVDIFSWEWERSAPSARCRDYSGGWTPIDGATSAVYAPQPADVGTCLRVMVVYTDNVDAADQQATGVLEVPVRGRRPPPPDSDPEPDPGFVNAAPVFPDQDILTEGDQSDSTSREVVENTRSGQNIGDPVSAHDEDGDLLIYTLGGADASSFRISRNDGQLKTRAPLNYEAKSTYTVVVTATDPFGAADSIVVTINVTDVDDPPVITVINEGP